MKKPEIVTYEPDNSIKKGYISIFTEIFHELKDNRWLTWQFFKRDFFAAYKQSFFGIYWAFVVPFVSVGTFIILNLAGVFSAGDIKVPYPVYAILGITFWNLFSTGLISSANSVTNAGDMITKIHFSKKSLVLSSLGSALVSFLLQLILIVLIFVFYRVMPKAGILLIPFVIMPILFLTVGLGFILALFNAVARDIGKALPMLITFLMFLTPVLYAKPKIGILIYLTKYNPLYYFISAARDLTLNGYLSEPKGFYISCVVSAIVFLLSLVIFHLTETRIAERI